MASAGKQHLHSFLRRNTECQACLLLPSGQARELFTSGDSAVLACEQAAQTWAALLLNSGYPVAYPPEWAKQAPAFADWAMRRCQIRTQNLPLHTLLASFSRLVCRDLRNGLPLKVKVLLQIEQGFSYIVCVLWQVSSLVSLNHQWLWVLAFQRLTFIFGPFGKCIFGKLNFCLACLLAVPESCVARVCQAFSSRNCKELLLGLAFVAGPWVT